MLTAQGVEAQTWEAALANANLQKHNAFHWKLTPENSAKLTELWSSWIKFTYQSIDDKWPLPTARSKKQQKEDNWLRSIRRETTQASPRTESSAYQEQSGLASQPDTRAGLKPSDRAGPEKDRITLQSDFLAKPNTGPGYGYFQCPAPKPGRDRARG